MLKRAVIIGLGLVVAIFALLVVFGGPGTPHPMGSITDPFGSVDFSDLPQLSRFTARDGTKLAYRSYPLATSAPSQGSVVLIHGSSATSSSMHPMAKPLSAAGFTTYALDIRGHGSSGRKGQSGYIGQLEDDLVDFMATVSPPAPVTLAGFSSGGGFALRFAGSSRQNLFQSYLFLAPFLSQDAPSIRPAGGGWVSVGVPRIVALSILNRFGLSSFNSLPVLRFAVSEETKTVLTSEYSYALETNFRPHEDYMADLRNMRQPFRILIGENDEVYYPDRFAAVLKQAGKDVPVTIVPAVDHIHLILSSPALENAVEAVRSLHERR